MHYSFTLSYDVTLSCDGAALVSWSRWANPPWCFTFAATAD
jgi:hypothetical protein